MGKTRAEIQKEYRERKKKNPNYVESERQRAKKIRDRIKKIATSETKKNLRAQTLQRVHKFRELNAKSKVSSAFKSTQSKGKALKKVKHSLPKSVEKTRSILAHLMRDHGSSILRPPQPEPHFNRIPEFIIEKVQSFFRSDVISYVSSETKHRKSKENAGVEIRIMVLTIREAYDVFRQENKNIKMSLTTFQKFKPTEVKYMHTTSHHVCLCSVHENHRFKLESLYHVDKSILSALESLQSLENFLLCSPPTDNCYLYKCTKCKDKHSLVSNLLNQIDEDKLNAKTAWYEWKSSDQKGFKQVVKETCEGTVTELFKVFIDCCEKYFKHVYIQRASIEKFESTKSTALKENSTTVVFQIDWAENFRCFHQDSTQGGHYGYNMVRFSLYYQRTFVFSYLN